jgi:antagonist of KipI
VSVRALSAGLLTTVQDLGRPGHQREGVPVGGAMDPLALRIANLLVGNGEGDAALEVTLSGPTLRFEAPTLLALAGADLGAALDGVPLPPWRPALALAGSTLRWQRPASGCRTYLALAGGIAVPPVLGSRSTLLAAALGGVEGRALHADDLLPLGPPSALSERIAARLRERGEGPIVAHWGAGPSLRPAYSDRPEVGLLPGAHAPLLHPESARALHETEFRVSARADRTGYRLEGPPLRLEHPVELLSEPVTFGTVQLPSDGAPIVLMADRRTIGGYPRIGEVATADLPLLAQLRPGDRLRFRPTSLDEARSRLAARERDLRRFREGVNG